MVSANLPPGTGSQEVLAIVYCVSVVDAAEGVAPVTGAEMLSEADAIFLADDSVAGKE